MKINTLNSETNYQSISEGFTIVFLHGWGCDWQIWSGQIPPFTNKFNLIIPDLPAFGRSEIFTEKIWDSQDYVSWLKYFLDQTVGSKPFVLIGHSFGGKIASLYTQKYDPKNLKLLVLVDASGLPVEIPTSHKMLSKVLSLIPKDVKSLIGAKSKAKLLTKLGASTDNLNSTDIQKKILQKIVHENITDKLKKIKVNTLLIWGENDQDTPLSKGKEMSSLISDSKLEIIENSGHFPFIVQKDCFNSLLLKYISRNNK